MTPVLYIAIASLWALVGWGARGLWINYHSIRPTIRLAEQALRERDTTTARQHIDRASAMLSVL